jgi:hypothetical protein
MNKVPLLNLEAGELDHLLPFRGLGLDSGRNLYCNVNPRFAFGRAPYGRGPYRHRYYAYPYPYYD